MATHGMAGYGIYWALVEDLYNNANEMQLDSKSIAWDYRADEKIVDSVIKDFDLFVIDNNVFGSLSVQRRLEKREKLSKSRSKASFSRWDAIRNMQLDSKCNANAMQNDAKESKGKKSKGNERKDSDTNPREELILEPPEIIRRLIEQEYKVKEHFILNLGFSEEEYCAAARLFVGEKASELEKSYSDVVSHFKNWGRLNAVKLKNHSVKNGEGNKNNTPFWRRQ